MNIDSDFKSLIPPLSPDEYDMLEQNILRDGCLSPLVVWVESHDTGYCTECHKDVGLNCGDGVFECEVCGRGVFPIEETIIDGHNRYEICTKHGIDFSVEAMDFDCRDDAKVWIISNQLGRRNISPQVRISLALQMKSAIAAKAKRNQGKRTDICQNSDRSCEAIDTKKELAKLAGVSHDTVARYEKIQRDGDEETKSKLASGEITINKAFTTLKNEKKEAFSPNENWAISAAEGAIDRLEQIKPGQNGENKALLMVKDYISKRLAI